MEYAQPEYLMSAEALQEQLQKGSSSLRIYDCSVTIKLTEKGYSAESGEESWRQASIAGSGFMDLLSAFSDAGSQLGFTLPSAEALQEAYRQVGIDADSQVVLYSATHVMWATRAWWMLHSCGHRQVSVLDGGLEAWRMAGGKLAPGESQYPPGDFTVVLDDSMWADQQQVLEAIGDETVGTVNALPNAMHRGEAASPYGRSGHIAGSINVEYDSLLRDGRFLDADAILSTMAASGILKTPRTIAYCGAGISATVDAFALKLVGRKDVLVYDGSLSEWAREESLPMEVG